MTRDLHLGPVRHCMFTGLTNPTITPEAALSAVPLPDYTATEAERYEGSIAADARDRPTRCPAMAKHAADPSALGPAKLGRQRTAPKINRRALDQTAVAIDDHAEAFALIEERQTVPPRVVFGPSLAKACNLAASH
jgi:hypothetical protein